MLPAPRSPAESLAAIKVPDDLMVELVAAEPMVMDPIDVSWDAAGRMWVVEMADYPLGIDGAGKPGGRIRILESTRGDGAYDKSTLFAEGLRFPTSVMPYRHGVLVTAAPDILFLVDRDRDGRSDFSEQIFGGLGEGNQQHLTNGLQWGLDGWLHLANGNSGGKISSPNSHRMLEVGQRDFRVQPDEGAIELLSGQSQYGRNRDDWGSWFGCNNSNPIWHFALEERYLRRNPHLAPPNSTINVASVPGAARIYPRSETIARFNDPHGFNHFTSACGVMIYRDDVLGAPYAGNGFVCEPVHNLVHREIIRPEGVSFKSERAPTEQTSEFLASTDNWSRFTSVRAGPDGALYVVDMYRLAIEHPKWIPDAWQKQLGNLRAGENQGRIYRVRPKRGALRTVPRMDARMDYAEPAAWVPALESRSGLVRDLAQQQLAWRGDKSAAPAVAALVSSGARAETRGQALWTLASLHALSADVVAKALRDDDANVRRQAVRLSETFARSDPGMLAAVVANIDDRDTKLRQQVAYTLGEWPAPQAGLALLRLLRADEDRFVRAAALSSILPHADTIIAHLRNAGADSAPLLLEVAAISDNAKALAGIIADLSHPRAATDAATRFTGLATLLDWLQRNNKSLGQLQSSSDTSMADALRASDSLFVSARQTVTDPKASVATKVAAARVLGRGREKQTEDIELLASLLVPSSPPEVQLAAVTSLGRINRNNVPERLLAGWSRYEPALRAAVLDLITSRPAWANVLLDRIEADASMLSQVEPGRRVALTQHSNQKLAERAAKIFNAGIDGNRQKVIDRYLAAFPATGGDATRGSAIFANTCAACHKFGDVAGKLIGPDLAAVKDRSPAYLVTHILDPNRAVEDRYVLYSASTQDGRVLAGMLVGESGNSIMLLGLDGAEQNILRSELRSLVSTARSLMPDGLEGALDEKAMADLVAFLAAR